MKKTNYILNIWFFLFLGFSVTAQVDGSTGADKKGKKKAIKAIPAKELNKPVELKPNSDDSVYE